MTPDLAILAYMGAFLGLVSFVALYSSHRARRFAPTQSEDQIFRCADCGAVYTDDMDVDLSRCPQCGRMNDPIRF